MASDPTLRDEILKGCQQHWDLMDLLPPSALLVLKRKGIEKPAFETATIGVFAPLDGVLEKLPGLLADEPLDDLVCWQPIEAMKPMSILVSFDPSSYLLDTC